MCRIIRDGSAPPPRQVGNVLTRPQTPLHSAVLRYSHDSVVIEALLACKADPNVRDSNFQTPLEIAAARAGPEIVSLMQKQT